MIPRFLRPSRIMRRFMMRRGLQSSNTLLRFASLVYIGRMPFLRTMAMREGVYGRRRPWQALAAAFFVADLVSGVTKKEPEVLSVERLKIGDGVQVSALPPSARRARRSG